MDTKSVIAVATFSVSSSGLLLVNKLCLKEVALPSFLAVLQFVASVLCALGLAATGQAELDGLAWPRVRIYLVYIGLFATAIYSNMQALTHSNVETLIVFRACGPLMVSLLEWRLLGRTLPSRQSVLVLVGILLFALGYVASDKAFGAPARCALTPHPARCSTPTGCAAAPPLLAAAWAPQRCTGCARTRGAPSTSSPSA
jgi:GDP-mannose transporter